MSGRQTRSSKRLALKTDQNRGNIEGNEHRIVKRELNPRVVIKKEDVSSYTEKSANSKTLPSRKRKSEVQVKQESKENCGPLKKTIKFQGLVPVDEECTQCTGSYDVYVACGQVYDAMLNQTNVGQNNNKYYLLQLMKHKNKNDFCVWFRWGRVGKIAGCKLQSLPLDRAIEVFRKKFSDKTKNDWDDRKNFIKHPGKYDLLEMDYGKEETKMKPLDPKPKIKSKLEKCIQDVMNLIFDVKEFEQSVKEMEYDVKKAPLGKLTDKQIKAGYSSLRKVERYLESSKFNREMVEACSEFYTRIPHDFGMRRPPLITTMLELQHKLQLLEALSDIKIAVSLMENSDNRNENQIDVLYRSLQCGLTPISPRAKEYAIIQKYVDNTHAPTHDTYTLKIENIFAITKANDDYQQGLGNKMLLWHGSRLTNWCGILKQGLRIAPPEAPATGYMFGKGVYFADMVSKSANYCFASHRQNTGFLLLCEVALGEALEKLDADGAELPKGKHSILGLGKTVPKPESSVFIDSNVKVPIGKPSPVDVESALLYNEYVVYDTNQIKPRYLVKVEFLFKQCW